MVKKTEEDNLEFAKKFEAVRELDYSEKCKPHIQELRSFYFGSPNDTPSIGNFGEPILPGTPHFSFLRAGRIYRLLAAGMEYREAMHFVRLYEKADDIFEEAFREFVKRAL